MPSSCSTPAISDILFRNFVTSSGIFCPAASLETPNCVSNILSRLSGVTFNQSSLSLTPGGRTIPPIHGLQSSSSSLTISLMSKISSSALISFQNVPAFTNSSWYLRDPSSSSWKYPTSRNFERNFSHSFPLRTPFSPSLALLRRISRPMASLKPSNSPFTSSTAHPLPLLGLTLQLLSMAYKHLLNLMLTSLISAFLTLDIFLACLISTGSLSTTASTIFASKLLSFTNTLATLLGTVIVHTWWLFFEFLGILSNLSMMACCTLLLALVRCG